MFYAPNKLEKGDKVALIAPSGSIIDSSRIDFAMTYFRNLGLQPVEGFNIRNINGHVAGTEENRAKELNQAFADESIKGIFCIRGGNGAAKILDRIDYDLIKRNPKCFYGYSDISVIHAALNQKVGLITYHTPMAAEFNFSQADPYTLAQFETYIFNPYKVGIFELPKDKHLEFLVPGKAKGLLCGGNLAALASTMGTPYEIDTRGKIFFIEEVGESPIKIDRRINAFRLAGKLSQCAGIIFGDFTNCTTDIVHSLSLETVIEQLELSVPTIRNIPCGHDIPTASLPLGVEVEIDSDENNIKIIGLP